jgi:hypothetical protein
VGLGRGRSVGRGAVPVTVPSAGHGAGRPAPHTVTRAGSGCQGPWSGTMVRDYGSGASSWIGPGRGQSLVPVPSQHLHDDVHAALTVTCVRCQCPSRPMQPISPTVRHCHGSPISMGSQSASITGLNGPWRGAQPERHPYHTRPGCQRRAPARDSAPNCPSIECRLVHPAGAAGRWPGARDPSCERGLAAIARGRSFDIQVAPNEPGPRSH